MSLLLHGVSGECVTCGWSLEVLWLLLLLLSRLPLVSPSLQKWPLIKPYQLPYHMGPWRYWDLSIAGVSTCLAVTWILFLVLCLAYSVMHFQTRWIAHLHYEHPWTSQHASSSLVLCSSRFQWHVLACVSSESPGSRQTSSSAHQEVPSSTAGPYQSIVLSSLWGPSQLKRCCLSSISAIEMRRQAHKWDCCRVRIPWCWWSCWVPLLHVWACALGWVVAGLLYTADSRITAWGDSIAHTLYASLSHHTWRLNDIVLSNTRSGPCAISCIHVHLSVSQQASSGSWIEWASFVQVQLYWWYLGDFSYQHVIQMC